MIGSCRKSSLNTRSGVATYRAFLLSVLFAGVFTGTPGIAAQQGIPFGANVEQRHFCQILVLNSGTLTTSPDLQELSSKQAGGSVGVAELTATNGSFWISADAPTSFSSMPVGGDTGVTFSSTYAASGDTTTPETPGTTATKLKKGVSQVSVHLIATRTGSVFPAGSYSGEVTVRCE